MEPSPEMESWCTHIEAVKELITGLLVLHEQLQIFENLKKKKDTLELIKAHNINN